MQSYCIGSNVNQLGPEVIFRGLQGICWSFPPAGWFKLNVDGAFKGCGGLVRDDLSLWVASFGHNIGFCTTFTAELWGVLKKCRDGVGAGYSQPHCRVLFQCRYFHDSIPRRCLLS